jgi:multidrug efflux pump subunit AcrA (membrane-fusion protein)
MQKSRVLLFGLLVPALAGCGRTPANTPPAAPAAGPGAPLAVTIGHPEKHELRRAVEQPGHIEAFAETPLLAKVPGFVKAVNVDIGDRVKTGDILAELSVPEMDEELKQKQATVMQMVAEVEQARKLLAAAEAHVKSAEASVVEAAAARTRAVANFERWQSESSRVDTLVARGVIDAQTRDETRNQFRSAEAARDEVEAKVRSAEAAKIEAEARRDKAKADVDVAVAKEAVARSDEGRTRAMLGYLKFPAPFDGVVTARHLDVGHFLQPSDTANPIFVVTRMDPVRIYVDVPEADAPLIRDKAEAKVRVQALRGGEFTGTVTRTAWALDPKSRTLKTEIDLPNPPPGLLRPGMYAYASVTAMLPAAWTLPTTAIVRQGETTVAFTIRDGKAVRVPVQTGASDGTRVELLKWQLGATWENPSGQETFILKAAGISDGQTVTVAP